MATKKKSVKKIAKKIVHRVSEDMQDKKILAHEVVYNAGYGGYSLSVAACRKLQKLGHCTDVDLEKGNPGFSFDLPRHHPDLVNVVKELGRKSWATGATLCCTEIVGNRYRITEYDGWEEVETPDSLDEQWVVIS